MVGVKVNNPIAQVGGHVGIVETGLRVRLKQKQSLLGKPRYPGRTGTLVRQNDCTIGDKSENALWYIALDATSRAQSRVITAWVRDLEAVIDNTTSSNGEKPATAANHDVMSHCHATQYEC